MAIRGPSQMASAQLPDLPPPATVSAPQLSDPVQHMTLDDAIRIALRNSEVVRVLTGDGATSSGQTIYEPAIANTRIDQARARFDPTLRIDNNFHRTQTPQAAFDPTPPQVGITGTTAHDYDMLFGLSKRNLGGGTAVFDVRATPVRTRADGLPLNPQSRSTVDLGYTQPLLQGAGIRVNSVPIILAQIDTEHSFFRLKAAVQRLVYGTIEGYWSLVFARTDFWARQQQVKQGEWGLGLAEAKLKVGSGNLADMLQARSALAGYRAGMISAQANVLQREAALRNLLGLPPSVPMQLVPVTPPTMEEMGIDWGMMLQLATERRPDVIERKLIIEATQQRLLLADNTALPKVDATALYRWNGLEGRTPDRTRIYTSLGDFTGWTLGVNFSVPLGQRQARAELRREELILRRDQADFEQKLHSVGHELATEYRNLAQYYDLYEANKQTRVASKEDLQIQTLYFSVGKTIYLNVLQAISAWGNAVSSEARSLTQYNTQLANLEQQTGTILETHGIHFFEERFGSIGPMGRLFRDRLYPRAMRPTPNEPTYRNTNEPAENVFDLQPPPTPKRNPTAPPERIPTPPGQN